MRALFVAPNMEVGGAERQWSVLLPDLAARGLDVRLLTLDGEGPFFETVRKQGVGATCAGLWHVQDLAGWSHVLRTAADGADVVVSRGISAHGIAAAMSRVARAPHVATEHTFYSLLPPLSARRRRLMKLIAPRVAVAVAVADSQVPDLVAVGYRRDRIRVIPNGVPEPPTELPADREEVRRSLGIPAEAIIAIVVATLRPEKRIDDFVEAVNNVRGRNGRLWGLVVGGGPELERVKIRTRSMDGIVIAGERNDVPSLLRASDIACLSSGHEALSLALMEALAAGLPVVATDVGATSEIVRDGDNGFLVPAARPDRFADALAALAGSAETRAQYGRAGRALYEERYTFGRMADEYAELLERASVNAA